VRAVQPSENRWWDAIATLPSLTSYKDFFISLSEYLTVEPAMTNPIDTLLAELSLIHI